jgi:DNA-binding NtrC family response regulator
MTVPVPRFCVRIEHGDGPKKEIVSSEERLVIGSSPQADLVVVDADVSAIHCEIAREKDAFVLRDLGSANGTWLSGVRVREVVLPSEAYFEIGHTGLSFGCVSGTGEEVPLHPEHHFGELVGESALMRAMFARLSRVASGDTTVLLEGESGTGKHLAAQAIHRASARRDGPFVVVDCGAVPRARLEAELFGHERSPGAGAFVRAAGGTLLLDEVGELDIELQPRLLGVLERREVKPAGTSEPVSVDVRIIATTNQDLRRQTNEGAFREDLYYRLAVARVRLPPLREHRTDIPLLVEHFMRQAATRDTTNRQPDRELVRRWAQRPWPGNVRQLKNVVEHVAALGIEEAPAEAAPKESAPIDTPFKVAKARIVSAFEHEYLTAILAKSGGNITAAANAAGLDRVHFLRLLDRYGLRKTRNTPPPKA